jgi:very-short-patch-repair endonuclease
MSGTRLCASGHIATAHELIAMGSSRYLISCALAEGRLVRLRQGVYCCPHVNPTVAAAARLGGAVTCVTVLREATVWAGRSRIPHVQVPPKATKRSAAGVQLHWGVPRFDMTTPWIASRMQAMWQAIHCLDDENAIAALESAIHKSFLTEKQVAQLCHIAPSRLNDGIRRLINNSGSGLETIVRLRLQRAGHMVVAQAEVPGLGHQDLLVDGRLALEIDGEEWHGDKQFEIDRERDLHSARLGRRTIRLTSRHVLDDWSNSVTAIERALKDSHHLQNHGET